MVTDVSTTFEFDPALNPPSPFIVTAHMSGYDLTDFELPFLELSPAAPALGDAWQDVEDEIMDPDLYYGACSEIERLLADMSSAAGGKSTSSTDDEEAGRFVRPFQPSDDVFSAAELSPGRAPVVTRSRSKREGSLTDLKPGLLPVKGQSEVIETSVDKPTTSSAGLVVRVEPAAPTVKKVGMGSLPEGPGSFAEALVAMDDYMHVPSIAAAVKTRRNARTQKLATAVSAASVPSAGPSTSSVVTRTASASASAGTVTVTASTASVASTRVTRSAKRRAAQLAASATASTSASAGEPAETSGIPSEAKRTKVTVSAPIWQPPPGYAEVHAGKMAEFWRRQAQNRQSTTVTSPGASEAAWRQTLEQLTQQGPQNLLAPNVATTATATTATVTPAVTTTAPATATAVNTATPKRRRKKTVRFAAPVASIATTSATPTSVASASTSTASAPAPVPAPAKIQPGSDAGFEAARAIMFAAAIQSKRNLAECQRLAASASEESSATPALSPNTPIEVRRLGRKRSAPTAVCSSSKRPRGATSDSSTDSASADVSGETTPSHKSGHDVKTVSTAAASKLRRSAIKWRPKPDRKRVLTSDELEVLWFYGSTTRQKGNAASPDYVIALLSIASYEEQLAVHEWYKHKGIEVENPDDKTMTGGATYYELERANGRSLKSLPFNIEYENRTHCMGCKMPTSRNDLHRWCPPCCVKRGELQCPLTGLCRVCISMNFLDLKNRYKKICIALKKYHAGNPVTPRFLHSEIACQYDANVLTVDELKRKGKTVDTIPAGKVRPAIALTVLKPPLAGDVPIPTIDQETAPADVAPFTAGRYAKRGIPELERKYAKQQRKLKKLPGDSREGRRLTLLEVELHHRRCHKPLGAQVRAVKKRASTDAAVDVDEETLNHVRPPSLQDCRRRRHDKPAQKRRDTEKSEVDRLAPLTLGAEKRVTISFGEPDEVFTCSDAGVRHS